MVAAPTFPGGLEGPRTDSFAASLAVIVAGAEVLMDAATWIELNVAILYSLPLAIAAVARNRRLLWGLATGLIGATFAVYWMQVDAGDQAMRTSLFLDRVLAAICIVFSAVILDAWARAMDKLVLRDRAIAEQNAELERRRAEAEDLSMRKTQMLASLSHDIRTPLQAITLLSELVRRTAERPELAGKIPELAQRLQSNAVSVVDFLSEVIDLASFDSGRVAVNSSEFSLDALVAEQRQRLLALADSKSLEVRVEPAGARLWLSTDRVKLGRALANLISNAIKFTDEGRVTVRSGVLDDGSVVVQVIDTGCGMDAEHLDTVFGEYAQAGSSAQRSAGWGLGLAISRRMVRLLGGDIHVESRPGEGSTFSVILPPSCRADAHATDQPPQQSSASAG